jgi:hypothetical protein
MLDEEFELSDSDNEECEEISRSFNSFCYHNNNGSFTEHKVLTTEQVHALMEDEMRKVQDVVTEVSFT